MHKIFAKLLISDKQTIVKLFQVENVKLSKSNIYINNKDLKLKTLIKNIKVDFLKTWILKSPLAQKLQLINYIKLYGMVDLKLNLKVNFHKSLKLFGFVSFNNNKANYKNLAAKISGKLNFDKRGILPSKLKIYHSDKILNAHFEKNHKVFIKGLINTNEITKYLHGFSYITAKIVYAKSFKLIADLSKVVSDLPVKYKKIVILANYKNNNINLVVKDIANFTLDHNFKLLNGVINIGYLHKQPLPKTGIDVYAALPEIDMAKYSLSGRSNLVFNTINLEVINFKFLNKTYKNLKLQASKNNKIWQLKFKCAQALGEIFYNPVLETIFGRIKKLYLPMLKPSYKSTTVNKAVNLRIDDLHLGSYNLGKLILNYDKSGCNNCKLVAPDSSIKFNFDNQSHEKILKAKIQFNNLGRFLRKFKVNSNILNAKGSATMKLFWSNSLKIKELYAKLAYKIKDGQIYKLSRQTQEKIGLGKLLNILSLQTIPRRLKLDFTDLSSPGYSFDILKGDATLYQGILHLNSGYINGPVAHAKFNGEINLLKKEYNVEFRLSPHLTSSLPVIATLTGGPLAGIAAWMANKLVTQQEINYLISGPWKAPKIAPKMKLGIYQ